MVKKDDDAKVKCKMQYDAELENKGGLMLVFWTAMHLLGLGYGVQDQPLSLQLLTRSSSVALWRSYL